MISNVNNDMLTSNKKKMVILSRQGGGEWKVLAPTSNVYIHPNAAIKLSKISLGIIWY